MKRRDFIGTTLAAGAGWYLSSVGRARAQAPASPDAINVALIGAGAQGTLLVNSALTIPNLHLTALCDLWPYRSEPLQTYLSKYGHKPRSYDNYHDLLDEEKNLHAVIVATPDFLHAEQVSACLKAGLHVYCESMMSNTLEGARAILKTMRDTGKLLQIGYQRRSNPRYLHALHKVLKQANLPGQLTQAAAQWCQPVKEDAGWPKRFVLTDDVLKKHGYANMREFRNWQYFKKYSAGPFGVLGAHQLDVLLWFLGAPPQSVLAGGGVDFYKSHQSPDNLMAIYEFPAPTGGILRASYQLLTTTSGGSGNFELFMGTEGALRISEVPRWTKVLHEPHAPKWEQWEEQKIVTKAQLPNVPKKTEPAAQKPEDPNEVKVRETGEVVPYDIPITLDKPVCQPHLENFFAAIRGQAKLTCPAEVAFATEAVVRKTLQAVQARKALDFTPEDALKR